MTLITMFAWMSSSKKVDGVFYVSFYLWFCRFVIVGAGWEGEGGCFGLHRNQKPQIFQGGNHRVNKGQRQIYLTIYLLLNTFLYSYYISYHISYDITGHETKERLRPDPRGFGTLLSFLTRLTPTSVGWVVMVLVMMMMMVIVMVMVVLVVIMVTHYLIFQSYLFIWIILFRCTKLCLSRPWDTGRTIHAFRYCHRYNDHDLVIHICIIFCHYWQIKIWWFMIHDTLPSLWLWYNCQSWPWPWFVSLLNEPPSTQTGSCSRKDLVAAAPLSARGGTDPRWWWRGSSCWWCCRCCCFGCGFVVVGGGGGGEMAGIIITIMI